MPPHSGEINRLSIHLAITDRHTADRMVDLSDTFFHAFSSEPTLVGQGAVHLGAQRTVYSGWETTYLAVVLKCLWPSCSCK